MNIKQKIKTKLKSNSGASLMLALLLFMVCAVIGSLVLTAANSSMGRFADISESDQRYHSVRSAAELLIDEIDGEEFILQRTKTYDTTTVYTLNAAGTDYVAGTPTVGSASYGILLNGVSKETRGSDNSILTESFLSYIYGSLITNFKTESCFDADISPLTADYTKNIELNHSGKDSLKVTINETLEPNGTLTFQIHSNAGGKDYVLNVIFVAEINDNQTYPDTSVKTDYSYSTDGKTQTQTDTTTITRTTELCWHYLKME